MQRCNATLGLRCLQSIERLILLIYTYRLAHNFGEVVPQYTKVQ